MCQCSMQPGAVVPLAAAKGITANSYKEHPRIGFFAKAEGTSAEPKAVKGPSAHQRYNLR
jgi:hypothetical protein